MKPDYKNWVPKGMIYGLLAGLAVQIVIFILVMCLISDSMAWLKLLLGIILGVAFVVCLAVTLWCIMAHERFSYEGKRKLSKQIVEGTAAYLKIPAGGKGLDVGCGSGALTIACAKNNPDAYFVGIDRWGSEYASFSKKLCESNAAAENVSNTEFQSGDATALDFPDESFDAVTSNYVYHNVIGADRQKLLLETLRVLKKGGTFALHDIMTKGRFGDMSEFAESLRKSGYEEVRLIPTDNGIFMSKKEASIMMLKGSCLLVGKK